MKLTLDDIARFEGLENDRDRALAQGYTGSGIPTSPDHKKWIEYNQLKQFRWPLKSSQPGEAPGNESAAGRSPSPQLTSMVAMPRSTIPNQVPNMMLDLLLGAAAHGLPVAQASAPQSHLCTQAMMAHCLANSALCRCFRADHSHPSFLTGAPSLPHSLPLPPAHGFERASASTPGTVSSVFEVTSKTEDEKGPTDEDDECEDEAERESTQICLYLGKSWRPGISADVCRDSSDNWISEKLLRGSNNTVQSSGCTLAYRVPDGVRLESKGCVKVDCRLSLRGRTFPGEFQVHARELCAPDVILGRSWAQKHGAVIALSRRPSNSKDRNAQRRPGSDRYAADPRRKHTRSQLTSGQRVMKLAQRNVMDRDAKK